MKSRAGRKSGMSEAVIRVYQRDTGDYMIEKVPAGSSLKNLYGRLPGRLALHVLVRRKVYSGAMGRCCEWRISRRYIPAFVNSFDIDLSDSRYGIEEFQSFNEFFSRRLQPGARNFARDEKLLLSPGDGRLRAWEDIDPDRLVQVKGMDYSLKDLVHNEELAESYRGGTCLLLRLAPVDYHRFHFIADGPCSESKEIRGAYYSVNMIALSQRARIFCQNRRSYAVQQSSAWGRILYVEVGATAVGSIIQTYVPGRDVRRGDEKGYFKFGGSTILIFFEPGRALIDQDILEQSAGDLEVRVLAGDPVGRWQESGNKE